MDASIREKRCSLYYCTTNIEMLEWCMPLKTFKELGGETWKVRRLVDPGVREWSAFNPSIGFNPDGTAIGLFRSSNYVFESKFGTISLLQGNRVQNRLYYSELDEDFKPKTLTCVNILGAPFPLIRGVEDAKLYYRDKEWYFTGVIKERDYSPKPRMATFKLLSPDSALFLRIWDITNESVEKNWMVPSSNEKFDFIYNSTSVVVGDSIVKVRDVIPDYKNLRGTTNLIDLDDGGYLGILHQTKHVNHGYHFDANSFGYKQATFRVYSHRFARYSSGGVLTALSEPFYFDIEGIEFASGLATKDSYLYISYGQNDTSSHIAKIDTELALSMLKDV